MAMQAPTKNNHMTILNDGLFGAFICRIISLAITAYDIEANKHVRWFSIKNKDVMSI